MYNTKILSYKKKRDYSHSYNTTETIKTISKLIRQELLNTPGVISTWPSFDNQLLQGNFKTLALTKPILTSVLSGTVKCTKGISHLINSTAQDLTYNPSMGSKRTKKHVELGLCMKRMTGSIDAILWLNRFGHSISYDEIDTLETKLAEDQASSQSNTSRRFSMVIVTIIWNQFIAPPCTKQNGL